MVDRAELYVTLGCLPPPPPPPLLMPMVHVWANMQARMHRPRNALSCVSRSSVLRQLRLTALHALTATSSNQLQVNRRPGSCDLQPTWPGNEPLWVHSQYQASEGFTALWRGSPDNQQGAPQRFHLQGQNRGVFYFINISVRHTHSTFCLCLAC